MPDFVKAMLTAGLTSLAERLLLAVVALTLVTSIVSVAVGFGAFALFSWIALTHTAVAAALWTAGGALAIIVVLALAGFAVIHRQKKRAARDLAAAKAPAAMIGALAGQKLSGRSSLGLMALAALAGFMLTRSR